MVYSYASFLNCTPVGQASDSMMARIQAMYTMRQKLSIIFSMQIFEDQVKIAKLMAHRIF